MKPNRGDTIAYLVLLGASLGLALGGGYLFNAMPSGNPMKAVGLGMLIVGFIVLFIWRIARRFPDL